MNEFLESPWFPVFSAIILMTIVPRLNNWFDRWNGKRIENKKMKRENDYKTKLDQIELISISEIFEKRIFYRSLYYSSKILSYLLSGMAYFIINIYGNTTLITEKDYILETKILYAVLGFVVFITTLRTTSPVISHFELLNDGAQKRLDDFKKELEKKKKEEDKEERLFGPKNKKPQ